MTSRTNASSKKQTNVPAPVLEMGRAISDQVMSGNLDFDNVAKKSAHVKWAGRSIALGTFPIPEAKRKAEEAKQLTKLWRTTKSVRPSREWVIDELERLHIRIVSSRRSAQEMKNVKSIKPAGRGVATSTAKSKKSGTAATSTTSPDVYAKKYAVAEKRIRRVSYVNSDDDDDDDDDDDEGDAPTAKRARTMDAIDVGTTATPAEPMTFTASLTNTPTTTGRRIMARRSSSLNLVASILNNTDFDALFGEGPSATNRGTDTAATAITRSETSRPASVSNLPLSLPVIENDPSDEDLDHDTMSDLSDNSSCSSSDHATGCVSPIPTGRRPSYAPSSALIEMLSAGAVAAPTQSGGDLYQDLSYYEKLKIHHMNLLEELDETKALLDLYQQHIVETHQL